jgi:hypothetical protein
MMVATSLRRISGGIACSLVLAAAVTAQQASPPLPVVPRLASSQNAFDRPGLIAFVRITETIQTERPNDEPGAELNTAGRPRIDRSADASVLDVLRINERKPEEPGLEGRHLRVVDQNDGGLVRTFEIGQLYVLLLSTTPELLRHWRPFAEQCLVEQCSYWPPTPSYFLASPQGGYKLTTGAAYHTEGRRLRVLKRGGPLDIYDGLLFDDVEKKLRNWKGY